MGLFLRRAAGWAPLAGTHDVLDLLGGPRLRELAVVPRVVMRRPKSRPAVARQDGGATLAAALAPFERHIRRHRVAIITGRCACYAFAAALPFAAARVVSNGAVPLFVPVLALLLVIVAGVVACWFQRLDLQEVARLLDQRLGLRDLLGTAIELESGVDPGGIRDTPVARAQHARAQLVLADTSPPWVIPRPSLRGEIRTLVGLTAIFLVLLLIGGATGEARLAASGLGAGGRAGLASRSAAHPAPRPNPFAHYTSALRTVARPAMPPVARVRASLTPSGRPVALPANAHAPVKPGAAQGSRGGAQPAGLSGTSGGAGTTGQFKATSQANAGRQGAVGSPGATANGTGQGGLHSTTSGTGSAPAVGQNRPTSPGASDNVGSGGTAQSGGQAPGNSSGNGGQPSGSGNAASRGRPGQMGGEQGTGGGSADSSNQAGGSAADGSNKGQPSRTKGQRGAHGAAGGGANARQGAPGGAGNQDRTPGRRAGPGAYSTEGSVGAMGTRPLRAGDVAGNSGSDQSSTTGSTGRPGGSPGGSSHLAGGVHDLLPNLGDQNISQQGMAFVISGQGIHGQTTDIGRANVFQPTGNPGGTLTANAPALGSTAPSTYIAPDTADVAPDQQALVKAYFDSPSNAQ